MTKNWLKRRHSLATMQKPKHTTDWEQSTRVNCSVLKVTALYGEGLDSRKVHSLRRRSNLGMYAFIGGGLPYGLMTCGWSMVWAAPKERFAFLGDGRSYSLRVMDCRWCDQARKMVRSFKRRPENMTFLEISSAELTMRHDLQFMTQSYG